MKLGKKAWCIVLAAGWMGVSLASGAAAQTKPESETLLEAIEDGNNNDVIDLVTRRGRGIVNSRGYAGATPLTLAMRKRANLYVSFLLQNGADPDLPDRTGETALMIAARTGNMEGLTSLLDKGATVDAANRQGETALIIAVQGHQTQAAKKLLEAGASATRTDSAQGLSARDYAVRDRRSGDILKLIDSTKAKPKFIAGPVIN